MTLPPERAAELAKSPKANKWKMIKAKVDFSIVNGLRLLIILNYVALTVFYSVF